jgi:predicted RNA methylase
MGQYSKKGLYTGYDKNHKEREALDYYATPTEEVTNILEVVGLDLAGANVLEPCCGGGHMVEGIYKYAPRANILATDVMQRTNPFLVRDAVGDTIMYHYGTKYDFLSDDYPIEHADYVIMNPPFSVIIPFVQRSLEIADKGVLMLGRLKFVESQKRYTEIFKDNPPTKIWAYVDRIACYKNGDLSEKPSSIEAYAWFYWDKADTSKETKFDWIWSKK